MRRLPNFVLLRAFEAAGRLQSFTLAAQELHLTQSAISHQVKELEEHFGQPLFHRRNRRVEMTPEAERLQISLAAAFDAIESACQGVALSTTPQVLSVHCSPSFAGKWLGPRLPSFMQSYPDITIRLSSGAEPLDLTRLHDVDVAISYGSAPERPGLTTVALGEERITALCSPALIRPGLTVAQQLAKATLIDSQLSPVTWVDWFEKNALALPATSHPSFDRASLVLSAAVDGMGIALESVRLAERELATGELIELGGGQLASLPREVHFLSFRAHEANVTKVRVFREWLWREAALADQAIARPAATAAPAAPTGAAASPAPAEPPSRSVRDRAPVSRPLSLATRIA